MRKFRLLRIFLVSYVFIFMVSGFGGLHQANASEVSRNKTFVIGRITENPKKHHAAMEKMGAYLLAHLKDLGYEAVNVVMAKNVEDMEYYMREGKVDALSETAFAVVQLIDKSGAELLLREWKKGVASYWSVFFAAKDGGIDTIEDLKGKRIVFEDPGSTSAFLIPFSILRLAGIEAVELEGIDQKPPADKVGYIFTHDEMTQLMLVARGDADAGAFSNLNWDDFQETKIVRDGLKLIHEGDPVMRSAFIVRRGLSDAVKARIAETLLSMEDNEDGRQVLQEYNDVRKYDQLSDEEVEQSLLIVRRWADVFGEVGK